MKINGFEVKRIEENGHHFLKCNDITIPELHLIKILLIVRNYEKLFGISDNIRTTEHILNENIFGMVVNFNELEKDLYVLLGIK